jgi:hypothetical protein
MGQNAEKGTDHRMNRTRALTHLIRGTLVAGALAASLGAGIALADEGPGAHGNRPDVTPPPFSAAADHRNADESNAGGASAEHSASRDDAAAEHEANHGTASLERRDGVMGFLKADSFTSTSFVLETGHWGDVTVLVDDATEFRMEGQDEALDFAAFMDLVADSLTEGQELRLNVQGERDEAGELVARQVNVHEAAVEAAAE